MKSTHEFRDPVFGFISCSSMERAVIDSAPFQRLRNIHQLALTCFVYPGATHKRFEHSLGVMELASRVFDVITNEENLKHLPDRVRDAIPELQEDSQRGYWRSTLRMAALCHDLGHLPFSHAAEKELLPDGYTHERMSWEIIQGAELAALLERMNLKPRQVAKIAIGQKDLAFCDETLSTWETLLSEIIVGDAFGVDRMDYLLRDSLHLGISYGNFDIVKLIPGLRITYKPNEGPCEDQENAEPFIGVERGALHAAASLLWARYSIFSQVYFHHVRRIYDIHLQDFIKTCFPERFPIALSEFVSITDNNILVLLYDAARDVGTSNHELAVRITGRKHFRCVYHLSNNDKSMNINALQVLFGALQQEFSEDLLRCDSGTKKHKRIDFPVLGDIDSDIVMMASQELPSINKVPDVESGYIFADQKIRDKVRRYIDSKRLEFLQA